MFSTLEEFKNNQLSSGHLGITKNNLEGYYNGLTQHLNTEDWGNLYHNFNHLTKLGVLKNEVLVRYYEGWFGLTNYRLYANFDSGLTSVPISSIVKYASYTTPDTEEFKKAKIF